MISLNFNIPDKFQENEEVAGAVVTRVLKWRGESSHESSSGVGSHHMRPQVAWGVVTCVLKWLGQSSHASSSGVGSRHMRTKIFLRRASMGNVY